MSCAGEDREFNFGQVVFYLPVGCLSGDLNRELRREVCSGNRH